MLARWCLRTLPVSARRYTSLRKVDASDEPLKGWQEDAIQACTNAIDCGLTKIALHISGTTTISALMNRIPPPPQNDEATRLVVVAISEKRTEKMAEKMLRKFPHWSIDVHNKRKIKPMSKADVFLTTYRNLPKARAANAFDESNLKAIILVDAHHAQHVFYETLAATPCFPIVIGTSSLDDFNALGEKHMRGKQGQIPFYEEVVYRRSFLDELQDDWECDARFLAVTAPIPKANTLSHSMSQRIIIQQTVHAWLENAATRKSTLIYCVDDMHALTLANAFQEAEIDARRVSQPSRRASPSDTEQWLYDKEMGESSLHAHRVPSDDDDTAAFKAGEFPVLLVARESLLVTFPIPTPSEIRPKRGGGHPQDRLRRTGVGAGFESSLRGEHGEHFGLDRRLMLTTPQILSGMKASPETLKEDTLVIEIMSSSSKRVGDICSILQLEPQEINGQSIAVLRRRAEEKAKHVINKGTPDRYRKTIAYLPKRP
ncbi:hypothetical protein C8R44DRAFT_866975 [Mycena epipterygia]|nr:hypothetical protein C8R44DRAFT_866975 [Mycena epipterygia]